MVVHTFWGAQLSASPELSKLLKTFVQRLAIFRQGTMLLMSHIASILMSSCRVRY